jgi:hypothetical protein
MPSPFCFLLLCLLLSAYNADAKKPYKGEDSGRNMTDPGVEKFINTYINYGASASGGAPDCAAFTKLFGTNVTTQTPLSQSGTGCQDMTDPAMACAKMAGCFSSMSSKITGTVLVEDYSATFQRVGFTWQLNAQKAQGGSKTLTAMSSFVLGRIPGSPMGMIITNEWAPNIGASDMYSECMCYC